MDYASNSMANAAAALNQFGQLNQTRQRPLESIATATQRVNSAIVGVQDFLDRWHGPRPEAAASGATFENGPCYSGELERLMSAIERLESRIAALNEIG
jgi:prefoldin subunit 5